MTVLNNSNSKGLGQVPETGETTAHTLSIRFHPSFDIFLKRHGTRQFTYRFNRKTTICDIVESLGVPHTEVGEIRNRDRLLGFHFIPRHSMAFDIGPVVPPFDIHTKSLLRPKPFSHLRFMVDENVAKLASLLRILGIDTSYVPGIHDKELAHIAHAQMRVVLSRDTQLFKRKAIIFGHYIRSILPLDQLKEILDFFLFNQAFSPFSRCLDCNTPLIKVSKEQIVHRLEPKTKLYFNEFKFCKTCDKIVWKGSHHDHMIAALKSVGINL